LFSFEADVAGLEADGFGKNIRALLRQLLTGRPRRPCSRPSSLENVACHGDRDARDAETKWRSKSPYSAEMMAWRRRGAMSLADHEPALGGELADRLAVDRVDA
jgi:hypothetical protein